MMKFFTNKKIWEKVILALLFVILFQFAVMQPVQADVVEFGGKLMSPILSFFVSLGDGIMDILGRTLMGATSSLYEVEMGSSFWETLGTVLVAVAAAALTIALVVVTAGAAAAALAAIGITASVTVGIGTVVAGVVSGFMAATWFNDEVLPEDVYLPMYTYSAEEIFKGNILLFDVNFFDDVPEIEAKTNSEGEKTMNFDFITGATVKELEQFKAVCNQLLSRTYVVRTTYQPGKGRVDNSDYLFLSRHYEAVQEYLSLLDWDLRRDDLNGYFYVLNTDEANRCNLSKKETAILLALRLIYEENMENLGLEQDAICTVRDVLEKVVTDYQILPAKPNMEEVKRALTLLENHAILQRIEGKFNQNNCQIAILPTILSAVSADKLNLVVSVLRKEEPDEETEENPTD